MKYRTFSWCLWIGRNMVAKIYFMQRSSSLPNSYTSSPAQYQSNKIWQYCLNLIFVLNMICCLQWFFFKVISSMSTAWISFAPVFSNSFKVTIKKMMFVESGQLRFQISRWSKMTPNLQGSNGCFASICKWKSVSVKWKRVFVDV